MVLGLVLSTWLSLIGFYLVRGTLTRDIDTRVWQLLVATPMTRRGYLFAKWFSHMLVFAMIGAAALGVGLAAQLVRGEDRTINLVELAKPMLLLGVPGLALTAMFSIWFDMLPALRRTAGNVVYFFIWVTLLAVSVTTFIPDNHPNSGLAWMSDPGGIVTISREVIPHVEKELSVAGITGMCLGCGGLKEPPTLFTWTEWPVPASELPSRLFWLVLAIGGVMLAAPFLDRAAAATDGGAAGSARDGGRKLRWLALLMAPLRLSSIGTLVAAEVQVLLRRRLAWWWLALLISLAVQLFAPTQVAVIAVIVAWLLFLDAFSRSILRERETRTGDIVFCAANAGRRILLARWFMLVLFAWLFSAPAGLRFALTDPAMSLAILAVGLSLATWGPALGALTSNSRSFELLVCVLAYIGLQGVPVLNVATVPQATAFWHLALLPVAIAVLLVTWPRLRRAPN
jgi:hypothetical protein